MATSQHIHKTSPIPFEDFRPGHIKPCSHSEEEIANVMIEHLERIPRNFTDIQEEGFARFKYAGFWNLGEPHGIDNIKRFFDIFNAVYFNGTLTGYYKLETWSGSYDIPRLEGKWGYCFSRGPGTSLTPGSKSRNPLPTLLSAIPKTMSRYLEWPCVSRYSMKWFMQYFLFSGVGATLAAAKKSRGGEQIP
jgi:hypothetical protein